MGLAELGVRVAGAGPGFTQMLDPTSGQDNLPEGFWAHPSSAPLTSALCPLPFARSWASPSRTASWWLR